MTIRLSGAMGLAGSVICWGAVPVMLRYMTGSVDGWTANGIRYPLAAILYWPVLLFAARSGVLTGKVVRACLVPAFFSLGGQIFWAQAPYHLPASTIGFLVRLTLVWSMLGAMWLFHDERKLLQRRDFFTGLLLVIGGFLSMSYAKGVFSESASAQGIAIMLSCSLFFGGYAVSVRQYLQGIAPIISFGIVAQIVAAGTLPLMFLFGDPSQLYDVSSRDWVVLVASSILGIALGHFFLYSAVRQLGPTLTTAIQTITPFVTTVVAYLALGERMNGAEIVAGIIMTLGAIVLIRCSRIKNER